MAGLLIENTLTATRVDTCIMGVGVNVNQCRFLSDAPNPVSLCQVTGHKVEPETLLNNILLHLQANTGLAEAGRYDDLHQRYVNLLYRRNEEHTYRDSNGAFRATLTNVERDGRLCLRDQSGLLRRYAFKEVSYEIGN